VRSVELGLTVTEPQNNAAIARVSASQLCVLMVTEETAAILTDVFKGDHLTVSMASLECHCETVNWYSTIRSWTSVHFLYTLLHDLNPHLDHVQRMYLIDASTQ